MYGEGLDPGEYVAPEDWLDQHEPGDTLRGRVVELNVYDTKHGVLTVIGVETAEGDLVKVPLGRSGLKPLVTKYQVEEGDEVAITFHGREGEGPYRYSVAVRKNKPVPSEF